MHLAASRHLPFSNWSLRPLQGEPAHGFFLRMVGKEGHYSASVYGNEIGINGRRLAPEETLHTLLSLPIPEECKDALRRFTPVADGAWHDLGGQRLRQRQMSFSTRRFCRACLAHSPHHRVWWDILSFRTCPEHGDPIEDCDESGLPIGWWWADIATDTSGRPLAKVSVGSNLDRSRTLEAFIVSRLVGGRAEAWPLLDEFKLFEVIEAAEFLGRWMRNPRSDEFPPADDVDAGDGMAILSGNREELVGAIRTWFTEQVPGAVRLTGRTASMGWAHGTLTTADKTSPEASIWAFLRQAVVEAFDPVGKAGKRRFRSAEELYAERALSALATDLGVKPDALSNFARHLGVGAGMTGEWAVTEAQESLIREAFADLLPTSEVSRILGAESWNWKSLVAADVLTSFSNLSSCQLYLRTDVERLVARAFAMATEYTGQSVSLRTYSKHHHLTMGDVLLRVLDGTLRACRDPQDQPGIRSIRIVERNRRRVTDWSLPNTAGVALMSTGEAAVMLHLEHGTMKKLLELGKIDAAGPRGCLSRESVVSFGQTYANAQLYRAVIGCRADEVVARLLDLGVETCFGFRVPNAVVKRDQVRQALQLDADPDHPSVAGSPLWDELQRQTLTRCPLLLVPPTVPEDGATIRTSNRRVSVEASIHRPTGVISLTMDLHEVATPRRWQSYMQDSEAIREALGAMSWVASGDGRGWRLQMALRQMGDVVAAVEALNMTQRFFR